MGSNSCPASRYGKGFHWIRRKKQIDAELPNAAGVAFSCLGGMNGCHESRYSRIPRELDAARELTKKSSRGGVPDGEA